ncbi:hypothetical protein ACWEWU_09315 [Staphylococcus xylosus]
MKKLFILLLISSIFLVACGKNIEITDITNGFKEDKLSVKEEKEMTRKDYGLAPMKAEKGVIFGVKKDVNNEYMNARLMNFKNEKDLEQTKKYYDDVGKESAFLYSHTYKSKDGKYLIQMNGEIDDNTFEKYVKSMDKTINKN